MKSRIKWFLICVMCMVLACSAAHALTYEEAISQASDSGDAADYLVLSAPEASRVEPDILSGLSAEWTYEGDELTITIDTEKTDWNQVVIKNYFPGSGEVYISPGFRSPTGEAMPHRSFGYSIGGGNTEKYMIELLKRDYEQWGTNSAQVCRNGITLGRYDEDSGLFQPVEENRHGLMCAWGEDGELQFHYIAVTIRFSSTDPLTVKLPNAPASDIYALYDMPETDREKIAVTVESGNVHVEADNTASLSQNWGSIAVAVPEEAGSEEWSCNLSGSSINGSCQILDPSHTGLDRRVLQLFQIRFDDQHATHEYDATIEWVDETGTVRGYSRIYLSVSIGDPEPWPIYVSEWSAVPASRLDLRKTAFPEGVDAVYDENGLLTLSIDHENLPETANFGRAFYEVFVSPPSTNSSIRGSNQSSANDIFGAEDANWNQKEQLQRTRDEAQTYNASRSVLAGNIFRTYHQQGSDLTVYMTSEMTGVFAGRVVLISWWEDGADPSVDDPYLTEYIVVRQESCVRVLRSTPLDSEEDLPEVITQPVIVIPQGSLKNPNESMEFTAVIYPQKGDKSRYYKLELVDKSGNPVDLENGQYKVFLPFPEGISEEEKQSLELIHMTDAHVEIENMSINGGNLHLTDAGIWFQAKSFSPFMLTWGEESTGEGGESIPSGECPNGHALQYESAFEGSGFAEFCEEDCHEAYVEFIGPVSSEYPYCGFIELICSWEGEWLGEEPVILYAAVDGETYGEWTDEMPWDTGSYAVKMVLGEFETGESFFSIAKPVTECSQGHTLQYFLAMEGSGLAEVCTGEDCHAAFVEFIGPEKSEFVTGEPIEMIRSWEGEWLGLAPTTWYAVSGSNAWDTEAPTEPGKYVVHMEYGSLITVEYAFSIVEGEYADEPECENGNPLCYELVARPNGETNGVRQFCPDGCHDVSITFFAPFDITEGGELDYVCSWSGPWMGAEYPELEFAMNVGGEYVGWSTALPTVAGDYAMRMTFRDLITDYQTFSIFPAQEEEPDELILPAGLEKIEFEAFAGTDVESVVCPDGLKEIASRAFAGCENLAVIVIPGSVESIAQDAFHGCGEVLIMGEEGSAAQQFASDAGLPFEEM